MKRLILTVFCTLAVSSANAQDNTVQMHEEAMKFPSSATCGTCHPTQFREWSVSPHAYSGVSPVANAMQGTVIKRTNGTNGDFCMRCHNSEGMALSEQVFLPMEEHSQIAREGTNCVTCHRINHVEGKINNRTAIEENDLYGPVYGPEGGEELKRVQGDNAFNVATPTDKERRFPIHLEARKFFALTQPGFCGSCHDITAIPGLRLEEALSEYKHSPASGEGITCQDCHMGKVAGVYNTADNYDFGPAAVVNGKPTTPRRLSNHMISGPDHSIVHPGIFPHNGRAAKMATIKEWLTFDYKAGWGSDAYEDTVSKTTTFPKRWDSYDDRLEGHEVIQGQIRLLNEYMHRRLEVLRNGLEISKIVTEKADDDGIRFKVQVHNPTNGHSVPTGFGADRSVYLQVTVSDYTGAIVFQSGDLDPNGDLRGGHSAYVESRALPKDKYLFNLQSEFMIQNVRGGERSTVLTTNYSVSPLPFVRPLTSSSILVGRPPDVRVRKKNIPPLRSLSPEYEVKKSALTGKGPYKATVRLFVGMVPVSLIRTISRVGFDYGMSPRAVADGVVSRNALLWEYEAAIDTQKGASAVTWQKKEVSPVLWETPTLTAGH